MSNTDNNTLIINAAAELSALGLVVVGKSSKSRSSYWQLSNDEGQPRIRLSDHSVAYESSDCAVCVGTAQDDDVRLDLAISPQDAARRAVRLLIDAQCEHDRQVATGGYDRDESPKDHADADESEATLRARWSHV